MKYERRNPEAHPPRGDRPSEEIHPHSSIAPLTYNRMAERHDDCHCLADTRFQLVFAYQKARDYWAANPHDAENAPNEIHQSLEQWLIQKKLIEGPAVTTPGTTAHEDSIPHPPPSFVHDQRRRNRRLPNFRRLSMHNLRRLSLPNPVPDLSGAFGPRRGRLMRRNTEGSHTSPPDPTTSVSAGPASGGWRHFTNPFKVPKKRSLSMPLAEAECVAEEWAAVHDIAQALPCGILSDDEGEDRDESSTDEAASTHCNSPLARPTLGHDNRHPTADMSTNNDQGHTELTRLQTLAPPPLGLDLPPLCESPEQMTPSRGSESAMRTSSNLARASIRSEPGSPQPLTTPIDPAYRALVPVLAALEAYTDNPRRATISEEFNDEGYTRFWDTFAELSPKEILYAVYAMKDGGLEEVRLRTETEHSFATFVFALWALVSTALCVWLYTKLP